MRKDDTVKKEKKSGRRVMERICRRLDIPCDALPGGSLVTVRGRGQISVGGSRKILEYTSERLRIALSFGQVVICGRDLECISYGGGQISAEGVIDTVSFSEEDM